MVSFIRGYVKLYWHSVVVSTVFLIKLITILALFSFITWCLTLLSTSITEDFVRQVPHGEIPSIATHIFFGTINAIPFVVFLLLLFGLGSYKKMTKNISKNVFAWFAEVKEAGKNEPEQ